MKIAQYKDSWTHVLCQLNFITSLVDKVNKPYTHDPLKATFKVKLTFEIRQLTKGRCSNLHDRYKEIVFK